MVRDGDLVFFALGTGEYNELACKALCHCCAATAAAAAAVTATTPGPLLHS